MAETHENEEEVVETISAILTSITTAVASIATVVATVGYDGRSNCRPSKKKEATVPVPGMWLKVIQPMKRGGMFIISTAQGPPLMQSI